MTDLFTPMSPAERDTFTRAYVGRMRDRDGLPDPVHRTLDKRERFFRDEVEAKPVRWPGGEPAVDPVVFQRNLDRHIPEDGLDERMLWALASAKINRGERYGVELSMKKAGPSAIHSDDPHAYQELQELYHTRILRDAVETLGLEMSMSPPRTSLKLLIGAMTSLPTSMANVLIFVAELVGATVFGMMLAKARTLFAAQPKVLERLEALYGQILTDEVGHVRLMRASLGPVGLTVAGWLVGPMARRMVRDMPEVDRLFDRRAVAARAKATDLAALDALGAVRLAA